MFHGLEGQLVIVSALGEELKAVETLISDRNPLRGSGLHAWRARRGTRPLGLLKVGLGPTRAASRLARFLEAARPERLLLLGYAGALHAQLRVGDLVAVERASLLSFEGVHSAALEGLALAESWALDEAIELCARAPSGLALRLGNLVTSPAIIGAPAQKRRIHEVCRADLVDMETAALARVAAAHHVPITCVRAVSDGADDEFLAPFGYDPAAAPALRAGRILAAGNWLRRYRDWRRRAARARQRLGDFAAWYLQ
jgi:nucleoside phosphorylase